jgi:hypothetical protein
LAEDVFADHAAATAAAEALRRALPDARIVVIGARMEGVVSRPDGGPKGLARRIAEDWTAAAG